MTALRAASHTGEIRVMSTLGPIRTGDPLVRNEVRYPLRHEGRIKRQTLRTSHRARGLADHRLPRSG
jgi:hypothetical protein